MNSYCWVLLAISLAGLYGSGLSNPCFEAITRFSESHMMTVPVYCQEIQMDITNNMSYRFDLSESTVNDICDESNNMICLEALQMITLICANFPKKDINCLDSPAIITSALCPNSDSYNDTRCYTSLARQGVISSPDMLKPCLDAYINGDDCSSSCSTILMNADCCFVSYYAFMLDVILDSDGRQVFQNHTEFSDDFWGWCNLPSPSICAGVTLADNTTRNAVTCSGSTDAPTDSPTDGPDGASDKPAVLYLIILFILLIILFM